MKIHEKMAADQLWVRSHSYHDQFSIYKPQGQHFMLLNAPNHSERVEMSMRSIGRKFDWDIEKYRLNRKFSDKGGRRRLMKNISRFMKNPIGYVSHRYWRYTSNARFIYMAVCLMAICNFNNLISDSQSRERIEAYTHSLGGTVEKSTFQYDQFRDGNRGMSMMPILGLMYQRPDGNLVVANPTYNQNYRLYFDRMDYQGSK